MCVSAPVYVSVRACVCDGCDRFHLISIYLKSHLALNKENEADSKDGFTISFHEFNYRPQKNEMTFGSLFHAIPTNLLLKFVADVDLLTSRLSNSKRQPPNCPTTLHPTPSNKTATSVISQPKACVSISTN